MKRFTILFSVLLVLGFAGVMLYVKLSPDFVPPAEIPVAQGEDPDAPVWDMSLEEVLQELQDQGLIDVGQAVPLSTADLCSDAYGVNGAEFYWWDLDNLDPDSKEYQAYQSLKEEGIIDLFGSGAIIAPISNGPFALLTTRYEGDADALSQAFMQCGQTGETEASQ